MRGVDSERLLQDHLKLPSIVEQELISIRMMMSDGQDDRQTSEGSAEPESQDLRLRGPTDGCGGNWEATFAGGRCKSFSEVRRAIARIGKLIRGLVRRIRENDDGFGVYRIDPRRIAVHKQQPHQMDLHAGHLAVSRMGGDRVHHAVDVGARRNRHLRPNRPQHLICRLRLLQQPLLVVSRNSNVPFSRVGDSLASHK